MEEPLADEPSRIRGPRRRWLAVGLALATVGLTVGLGLTYAAATESAGTRAPMAVMQPAAAAAVATLKDTAYPAPATAVYASPAGNDAAAGTLAAPLRTVAKAVAKVPAGGTIVLRSGSYREDIGTVSKKITLQPYPHEQVWLKGSDVVSAWVADGAAWRAQTWTSPFCQDCYPAGAIDPAHPLAGRVDQVFRNDQPLRQVAARSAVVAGTFFVDAASKQLWVGDNPASSTVEVSARWRSLYLNGAAAGSVVRGVGFSEYAPHWNEDQIAAVVDGAAGSVLENDTFTRSSTRSLGVVASGVRVEGNLIVDNGGPGATLNRADDVMVKANTVERNNNEHYNTGSCGAYCTMAGMKVAHTARVTVADNSFGGNDGAGFWCDLGCTDGTITGNTVTANTGNGLFWEVSARATISGNKVSGNGRGVKISGSDHVTVNGNTFTGNAIQLGVYDDARLSSTDGYSGALGLSWNTTNTVITANTFAGNASTRLLVETNKTAQINAAQMIERAGGNIVSGVQTISWCPANCTSYPTLAAFTAATGIGFGTVGAPPTTPPATTSPSTSPPAGGQLVLDPGLEATPPGAAVFGPATVLTAVATAHAGGQALQIATTAAGPVTAGATLGLISMSTTAGTRYTGSCWARSASRVGVFVQVQQYTQGWIRDGDAAPSARVALDDPTRWYQVTVSYTATRSGDRLPLAVLSNNLTAGGATIMVDDCSLTAG